MQIIFEPKLFLPIVKLGNLNHRFLNGLAKKIVSIIKQEIKQESFDGVSKDLINSWSYRVSGDSIHIFSNHDAFKDDKDKEVEEEEVEKVEEDNNVDETVEPVVEKVYKMKSRRVSITNKGEVTTQKTTARTLSNGEWLFPSSQTPAFMVRANKRILKMLFESIQKYVIQITKKRM
jgi:hypothetical protein